MANPFENENTTYHVLVNAEGQHSLWPCFVDIPAGWKVVLEACTRAAGLDFVNKRWTDMRPRTLIEATSRNGRVDEQALTSPDGVAHSGLQAEY